MRPKSWQTWRLYKWRRGKNEWFWDYKHGWLKEGEPDPNYKSSEENSISELQSPAESEEMKF